jgi:hypothetical protein
MLLDDVTCLQWHCRWLQASASAAVTKAATGKASRVSLYGQPLNMNTCDEGAKGVYKCTS